MISNIWQIQSDINRDPYQSKTIAEETNLIVNPRNIALSFKN